MTFLDILLRHIRKTLFIRLAEQKRRALPKGGARQVVKAEIRLWYFCGQMRNRRSENCGDFQFWWT